MNARNASLQELADGAQALNDEPYDSPKVDLWESRMRKFVSDEFGEEYQQLHDKAMDDTATFLRELQDDGSPGPDVPTVVDADLLLRMEELHPRIREGCAEALDERHLAEAVEKGFKIVHARLRKLTGYETGSEAFGSGDLRVRGAIDEYVEDDFNEAVKFLTMAVDRFRNEKPHTADAHIDEPVRAAEYLAMNSLAMRFLDDAYIKH